MDNENKNTPKKEPESDDKGLELTPEKIKEIIEKNKYLEEEAKKAFEKRDKAKAELERIRKEELEKQGEYKNLYEKSEQEKAELAKIKADAEAKAQELENKLKELETQERNSLIEQVAGEAKEFAEKLNLTELRDFVKLYRTQQKSVDRSTRFVAGKTNNQPKTLDEWEKIYDDYK